MFSSGGADDLAAARHLQAAIRRLRPGGGVVAIMPDWFAPSARLPYPSMFGAMRISNAAIPPRPVRGTAANAVLPVAYTPLLQPAPLAQQVAFTCCAGQAGSSSRPPASIRPRWSSPWR